MVCWSLMNRSVNEITSRKTIGASIMSVLLIDGWYDLHKSDANIKKILDVTKNKAEQSKYENINQLYKDYSWHISPGKFFELLFYSEVGENGPREYDYTSKVTNEFAKVSSFFSYEEKVQCLKDNLLDYINKAARKECLLVIRDRMKALLRNTKIHDAKLCEELYIAISELDLSKDYSKWVEAFYYYIHFAVTGILDMNIGYRKYKQLYQDLDEYQSQVVMGYGCSGVPGISKIYSLANRENPNIIALYEMGEMEYYGRGTSGKVDYSKAYDYYCKTLELNDAHPLALWSIAYMKFEYRKKNSQLENAYIEELEEEYPENAISEQDKTKRWRRWCEDIINKVQMSYNYGCTAAANLIGKIIEAPEESFPFKQDFKYKNEMDYYKVSADGNYAFGCNNYGLKCLEKMKKEPEKSKEWAELAVKYFMKSADSGEAWALNKMAIYYMNGLVVNDAVVVPKDKEKAYELFSQAEKFCGMRKYYWPIINLVKNYWLNIDSKYYLGEEKVILIFLDCLDDINEIDQLEGMRKVIVSLKSDEKREELLLRIDKMHKTMTDN